MECCTADRSVQICSSEQAFAEKKWQAMLRQKKKKKSTHWEKHCLKACLIIQPGLKLPLPAIACGWPWKNALLNGEAFALTISYQEGIFFETDWLRIHKTVIFLYFLFDCGCWTEILGHSCGLIGCCQGRNWAEWGRGKRVYMVQGCVSFLKAQGFYSARWPGLKSTLHGTGFSKGRRWLKSERKRVMKEWCKMKNNTSAKKPRKEKDKD